MEEVNLRIKSPSAVLSDLQFAFATNLTVLGLKERIAVDYETHPLPRDQKLVYSGKLLKDTDRCNLESISINWIFFLNKII